MSSEYRRRVADLAEKYGRRVELTNGGHYRLTAPGKPAVFASFSTSDPVRGLKNLEANLKKIDGKVKS